MAGLSLDGIERGGASQAWAAGAGGVVRIDGSGVTPAPGLPPLALSSSGALIAPLSDSDIWIDVDQRNPLLHWDGSTWTLVPVPAFTNGLVAMSALPSPSGPPRLLVATTSGGCGGSSGNWIAWTDVGWQEQDQMGDCAIGLPQQMAGVAANDSSGRTPGRSAATC